MDPPITARQRLRSWLAGGAHWTAKWLDPEPQERELFTRSNADHTLHSRRVHGQGLPSEGIDAWRTCHHR